jgi:hypothetical protein
LSFVDDGGACVDDADVGGGSAAVERFDQIAEARTLLFDLVGERGEPAGGVATKPRSTDDLGFGSPSLSLIEGCGCSG